MELAPGTDIQGRYVVEARIGSGGMAEVYRVRHQQLDTLHALKVLTITKRSVQRRLMQEGRVQAMVQHPNIVRVTDLLLLGDAPGLVMEYVRGPALDGFIGQWDFTHAQLDALASGAIDGVAAAHALGLIHRDLKPANIMLHITPSQLIPKVADFGLVKMLIDDDDGGGSKTRTGVTMGSPAYMPPEQIQDAKGVDARADVWSMGAVLYELLTGVRPFDGDGIYQIFTQVTSGKYLPVRERVPDAPERMVRAIEGALVVDRDQRWPSIEALKAAWLQGVEPASQPIWPEKAMRLALALGAGSDDTHNVLKRSFRNTAELPTLGGLAPTDPPARRRQLVPMVTADTHDLSYSRSDETMDLSALDGATDEVGLPLAANAGGGSVTAGAGAITVGPELDLDLDGTLASREPNAREAPSPSPPLVGAQPMSGAQPVKGPARCWVVGLVLASLGLVGLVATGALVLGGTTLLGAGAQAPVDATPGERASPSDRRTRRVRHQRGGQGSSGASEAGAGASNHNPAASEGRGAGSSVAAGGGAVVAAAGVGGGSSSGASGRGAEGSGSADERPSSGDAVGAGSAGKGAGSSDAARAGASDQDGARSDLSAANPTLPASTTRGADATPPPAPLLQLDSDATVVLLSDSGQRFPPTKAPPGHYRVLAFFKEGVPSPQGEITLKAGSTPRILCRSSKALCRIQR